jgi:hypothetical protein
MALTKAKFTMIDSASFAPASGISSGTGTIFKSSVLKHDDLITTTMVIDLTGLNSGASAGDIIGVDGGAASYISQITAANNGTVLGVRMTCLEAPTGGDADIDLYSATENTGSEDEPISDLTETQIINSGTLSLGSVLYASNIADNQYLYLVGQGTSNATYTAGRILIEITGYK